MLIKGARAVDPANNRDEISDIRIKDGVIAETGRLTSSRIELEEQEKQRLDRYLNLLYQLGDKAPRVRITRYVPDSRKKGGAYVSAEGKIRRILPRRELVQMEDGSEIYFDEIW